MVFYMFNTLPSILIAEPDETLATVLLYSLEKFGFIVNVAGDFEFAATTARRIRPDLVVLSETILCDFSGDALCSALRARICNKAMPVILLTRDSIKNSNLKNDSEGATEYLMRPFSPSQLAKKIKEILHCSSNAQPASKQLSYRNIMLNIDSYRVTKDGKPVHLGPTEFKILQCLMELPSKILSREHIMQSVWGHNSNVEPRTIDVHINRLRAALKNNESEETPMIKTIRSAGYCLS